MLKFCQPGAVFGPFVSIPLYEWQQTYPLVCRLFFFELPFLSLSHFYVGLVVFARVELAFIRRALQLFGRFVIYRVTFL